MAEFDSTYVEPWTGSAILLVDLDAFFASVEQLDHPAWRGKPVIVGGDADKLSILLPSLTESKSEWLILALRAQLGSERAKPLQKLLLTRINHVVLP